MKGTRPAKHPEPSRTFGDGRVCSHPGCTTTLSVYNPGEHCWQHAEIVFPNYRGKRLAPN